MATMIDPISGASRHETGPHHHRPDTGRYAPRRWPSQCRARMVHQHRGDRHARTNARSSTARTATFIAGTSPPTASRLGLLSVTASASPIPPRSSARMEKSTRSTIRRFSPAARLREPRITMRPTIRAWLRALAMAASAQAVAVGDQKAICSQRDGDWSAGATWDGGSVPARGARVLIRAGIP